MIKLPDIESSAFKKYENAGKLLEWGLSEWKNVKSELKSFRRCIDIGAHVGLTSLRYAEYFDEVLAFEPVYFDLLRENTKHLKNVKPYPFAIGDKRTVVKMQVNNRNSGTNVVYHNSTKQLTDSRLNKGKLLDDIEVNQIKLDNFLSYDPVDFIKIDTEGYNLPVLEGAEETLKRYSPIIQMEKSNNSYHNRKCNEYLESLGYKLFHVSREKPSNQYWKKQ